MVIKICSGCRRSFNTLLLQQSFCNSCLGIESKPVEKPEISNLKNNKNENEYTFKTNTSGTKTISARVTRDFYNELEATGINKNDLILKALRHYLRKHLNKNETNNNLH